MYAKVNVTGSLSIIILLMTVLVRRLVYCLGVSFQV